MRIRTTIAAVLLLGAAATACGSSGEPETIRVTVTQTVTASPSAKAAANAADGVLRMGAKQAVDDD
ncbi:hypothetical protein ABZ078_21685 [Streptomyces sp. NPDC006385]|uniref:hypothetical protein n=1 Tax=Streptomyces sp. NPDC006385 TaxID=3156761 RepID=UPI0033B1E965